jgi:hypothetical protein
MPRVKPDLFLSWRPFVTCSAGTPEQGPGAEDGRYIFGTLESDILQKNGCVAALFEAKRAVVDMAAFGELVS